MDRDAQASVKRVAAVVVMRLAPADLTQWRRRKVPLVNNPQLVSPRQPIRGRAVTATPKIYAGVGSMDTMADPVGAVGASFIFGALILKLVDFVKYARNGDVNGLTTIVTGWVVGFVAIKLTLLTDWSDEIKFGAESLKDLGLGSQLVLALVATSVAGLLYDAKKAVDNTDTASIPRMTETAETARKARVKAVLGTDAVAE